MANGDDVEYHDEVTTASLDLATVHAAEYRMQNGQVLDHLYVLYAILMFSICVAKHIQNVCMNM